MKNIKQYYKELGKAIYAVAIIDKVITQAEREALHHAVLKDLVSQETHEDSSNMNEAFYADFSFDDAASEALAAKDALKSFVHFVHSNFEAGDRPLIERSMHVLEKVAASYSREKEKEVVSEIRQELQEVYRK